MTAPQTVAATALEVLEATPTRAFTTNELVTILREQHGFAPTKAYPDVVYSGLMSQLRAGKVARMRVRSRDSRSRARPLWGWQYVGDVS